MGDAGIQTRTIVGIEIHVQLATRTKMFCSCAVEFGATPNSRACPVCVGMPGVLPVMNRQAVDFAIAVGLALNCRIAPFTKWDRKSYYYPDLPKNYQISQYDLPLACDGYFETGSDAEVRRARIRRAHLEEDAGKNIHDTPGCTLVDLNRAGTPLLEIVTEPDIVSADHAYEFATELQRLVTYLGVSEGNMQKGQMRFEPNINVAIEHDGVEYRTPISEVKNLNSFRALRDAIDYESRRQVEEWRKDHSYVLGKAGNENRGWVDDRGVTEFQRGKEAAHDYRYFPEPDLVPVEIDEVWLNRIRSQMPELPLARRARFVEALGLSAKDAETIVGDRATADLFENAIGAGGPPAVLAKQFVNVWSKLANDRRVAIADLAVDADRMGRLAKLADDGTVSATAANQIAERMIDSPESPDALIDALGLVQVQDTGQTAAWVDDAFAANEKAVADALQNPKKAKAAAGFLRGQVMRISGGKADPKLVGKLITEKLERMNR
ncbi:MAG: Asp-tRNA(Asn)/Glu-tRNA(Gln) amidotransferase subunit GatB [Phycisphaerales bacterium]|nr:MAG: Asp-tRNA(Asn)/Glu-tRNA(Gln) amidotransferase subunit GatB [Phycisphaerales bacterium]